MKASAAAEDRQGHGTPGGQCLEARGQVGACWLMWLVAGHCWERHRHRQLVMILLIMLLGNIEISWLVGFPIFQELLWFFFWVLSVCLTWETACCGGCELVTEKKVGQLMAMPEGSGDCIARDHKDPLHGILDIEWRLMAVKLNTVESMVFLVILVDCETSHSLSSRSASRAGCQSLPHQSWLKSHPPFPY